MADKPAGDDSAGSRSHEFFRPWLLWDRCFALAPETSKGFARALLPGQEANRHRVESPRDAGICIRTWAAAYAQTKDEQFLRAIETLLETFEKKSLQASASIEGASPASTLSLAIDCHGAAHSVPGSLASRLRGLAWRQDEAFCALNHDLKHAAGFLTGMSPTNRLPGATATPRWNARLGGHTTAQVGLMCVARYDNGGGKGHRDLILAAADAYLDSMPPEGAGVWPGTFGQAISLQLAAWRHSARPVYLQRARTFADSAIEKFWGANALPRASLTSEHYETITGADTLALSLVELHLHVLHITAVRCPLNTLDR